MTLDKPPLDLDVLADLLAKTLPQEWLANRTCEATCQGQTEFIRVESEPSQNHNRFVCLICLGEPREVIVRSPDITHSKVTKTVKSLDKIFRTQRFCQVFGPCRLTLTECHADCSTCPEANEYYF